MVIKNKIGEYMKILLPSASLFGLPLSAILKRASQAGFDGVEIFLFGFWTREKVWRCFELAAKQNLILHFHQVWSPTESHNRSIKHANWLLGKAGWLPKDGYQLADVIPANARPLVVYADRHVEIRNGMWLQTISTCTPQSQSYKIEHAPFFQQAKSNGWPLVWDTMHHLEFLQKTRGVHTLTKRRNEILIRWVEFWDSFHDQVEEIHWNDFDPSRGEKAGRNIFPGDGIAPLETLAQMVQSRCYSKSVIPEIKPRLPFPYTVKELLQLRRKMENYFR